MDSQALVVACAAAPPVDSLAYVSFRVFEACFVQLPCSEEFSARHEASQRDTEDSSVD